MTEHLGYEKHAHEGRNNGNSRNVHSSKTIISDKETIELKVPRDRNGQFDPQLIPKHERHFDGFDEKKLFLCTHME